MTYEVLALKYRPKVFEDLVGQEAVTRTLINAIQQGRIANAFVFSGVRGVGKTTTARILAKALNCASGPTVRPCGECASCAEIPISRSLDVFEIDGASQRKVDETQELLASLQYAPSRDRFKILIVDEVHMFSAHSFNALLKTLEEPPPHVKFIFATTESHKIPDTILSRCQEFEFRTVSAPEITQQLKKIASAENIAISEAALSTLARVAEGSLRDGISAFDQVIAAVGTEIDESRVTEILGLPDRDVLRDTARAIVNRDTAAILETVDGLVRSGRDLRFFVSALTQFFRDVLVKSVAPNAPDLVELPQESELLEEIGRELSEDDLLRNLDVLTETEMALRTTAEPRFHLEMALLKLSQLRRLASFEELLARFEALLAGGSSAPVPTPSSDSGAGAGARSSSRSISTRTETEADPRPGRTPGPREPRAEQSSREAPHSSLPSHDAESDPSAVETGPALAPAPTATLERLVERLRTSKPMLHALVARHESAQLADKELTLRFASNQKIVVEQLQQQELKAMLDEQAQALFGRPFQVMVELQENGSRQDKGPEQQLQNDLAPDPDPDREPEQERERERERDDKQGTNRPVARTNGAPGAGAKTSPTTPEPELKPEKARPARTDGELAGREPAGGSETSGGDDLRERAAKDPMVRRFIETFQGEVEDVRPRKQK